MFDANIKLSVLTCLALCIFPPFRCVPLDGELSFCPHKYKWSHRHTIKTYMHQGTRSSNAYGRRLLIDWRVRTIAVTTPPLRQKCKRFKWLRPGRRPASTDPAAGPNCRARVSYFVTIPMMACPEQHYQLFQQTQKRYLEGSSRRSDF